MRITHDRELSGPGYGNPEIIAQETRTLLKGSRFHEDYGESYRKVIDSIFLPSAWPGMYPIIFSIADECTILCAACAKSAYLNERVDINTDIIWEGESVYCEDCGKEIESAYGVDEE